VIGMQYVYNINFLSPFNQVDSIKISGAMISSAFTFYPQKIAEIEGEMSDYGLQVSDLFPYSQNRQEMLFPSPLLPYSLPKAAERKMRIESSEGRKKDVKYSTLEAIRKVCECKRKEDITKEDAMEILREPLKGTNYDWEIEYYKESSEYAVSLVEETPKVYVRELQRAGHLRLINVRERTVLAYDPLWFIAKYNSPIFDIAIPYLEDVGLSAMFTRGKGHFVSSRLKSELKLDYTGNGWYILLSKYCPTELDLQNIDLDNSFYSIGTFTGISREGEGLPKIRYFKPGSVLYLKGEIKGRMIKPAKVNRYLNFCAVKTKVT
jgi:CRISPR type III-A-associated RAMP protein Csm4